MANHPPLNLNLDCHPFDQDQDLASDITLSPCHPMTLSFPLAATQMALLHPQQSGPRQSAVPATPCRIAIITGPTGVGKTAVAVAVAERLGAEIVSADSMAVYRGMDVATAKPSAVERERVPHHLIDVVTPDTPFSVAEYRRLALDAIAGILARDHVPLLVGGTRLYVKALTSGFFDGPAADPDLRQELSGLADREGVEALYARLLAEDPASAARIHPHDRRRLIRALEVAQLAGRSITELQQDSQAAPPPCAGPWVALTRERKELYRRIDDRADAMLREGLVAEVQGLLALGLSETLTAFQGHGYKEIMGAVLGRYPLERGGELLKRNTRRYAKRQLSWLRQEPGVAWVRADRPLPAVVDEVVAHIGG